MTTRLEDKVAESEKQKVLRQFDELKVQYQRYSDTVGRVMEALHTNYRLMCKIEETYHK
jgi:hypothetical protein